MHFDTRNFIVGSVATVLLGLGSLTLGVIANARADAKREAQHQASLDACAALSTDEAVTGCVVAVNEGP